MRLTAELLLSAPIRFNVCEERELSLRGLRIPAIENLGAAEVRGSVVHSATQPARTPCPVQDVLDAIDLSDNAVAALGGFPAMPRLVSLYLCNNEIARVESGLGDALPRLETLILTGNRVSSLTDISRLASLRTLRILSLLHNPVTRKAHYRYYTIFKFPALRILDFQAVKRKERIAAIRFFTSKAGAAVIAEVEKATGPAVAPAAAAAAAVPAASAPRPSPFTPEQMSAIRAAIAGARTSEEIDRLEAALKSGVMPPELVNGSAPATAAAH